jgi:hypothetical protein
VHKKFAQRVGCRVDKLDHHSQGDAEREREDEDILVIKKLSFMWDMTFFFNKEN